MRRFMMSALLIFLILFGMRTALPALAQTPDDPADPAQSLAIFTSYPAQSAELGATVTFPLTLRDVGASAQVVRLGVLEAPEGWTVTFRGGGRVIQAVYVDPNAEPGKEATAELRLEPPKDVTAGTYHFVIVARGDGVEAQFPIELTEQEKLPPSLNLDVELPTLKGSPTTSFRYQATLRNEGDQDLAVNLGADAPQGVLVTIRSSGQEVTSLPLKANESKSLEIEAKLSPQTPAGEYPITVQAQGGEAQATLNLTAEVTGQPNLSVTAPEGRLSGEAYAGRETSLSMIVQNTGSAATRDIEMSATAPTGWSVEFDPKQIAELPAGQQIDVTAKIRPSDKAVSGDYMVTVRARPQDGTAPSADFRITVLTSTLWGMAGVALIAAAVIVVGLAVARFGRR